jgi:hypothetical protein
VARRDGVKLTQAQREALEELAWPTCQLVYNTHGDYGWRLNLKPVSSATVDALRRRGYITPDATRRVITDAGREALRATPSRGAKESNAGAPEAGDARATEGG